MGNEAIPNRYTYSVSYTFTTADGQKVDGFTYRTGSAVYVKTSALRPSMVHIRYLKAFPCINALEGDSGLKPGNFILLFAGIVILKFSQT